MKSKAVWFAGVAGLAVLAAVGLHFVLPDMEKDIRVQVDKAMALAGMDDVKATVSGQTVTLTAMDADPDAARKLKSAEAVVAGINDPDQPKVAGAGQWLNGTVTRVEVKSPETAGAPDVGAVSRLAADSVPPAIITGEKATSIDTSVSTTPPVAGDEPPYSRVAAQACEEKIYRAMAGRKVAYVQGTYELTPESQPVLDDVYAVVKSCPDNLDLTVVGYMDSAGDAMAARLISQARAQAAADALVSRGLMPGRVSAEGQGQSHPVAANDTPEGREANRRVVFEVSEKRGGA